MKSKEEKLSILSQMIALANADKDLKEREYHFLLAIAKQLDVTKEELHKLFHEPAPYKHQQTESGRILQFYRLVLLMNVDEHQHPHEIRMVKECGLKMGLSPFAMDKVLKVMHEYEDKIVPTEVLLSIFKTHYN